MTPTTTDTTPAAPTLRTFACSTGHGGDDVRIEARTARAAARAYVEGGDWGPIEGAIWINVRVSEIGPDGEGEEETYKIQVDQDEPACEEGHAHRWTGCETRGHGGGTISTETCRWCGTTRTYNTWATDPEDGRQGYETTTYEVPARGRYERNPHARPATRYYGGAWSAEIEEGDRFVVSADPEGAAPGTWTGTWTVQDTAGVACGWTVTRGREERTLDELLRALNAECADLYGPLPADADADESDAD